jgi:N-acetylglutamate synthase/N-acetylornithine aminotransferase
MEIDFFFLREREQWKCNLKQLLAFFLYKKKVVTALAYSDNKVNAVPVLTAMQTLDRLQQMLQIDLHVQNADS